MAKKSFILLSITVFAVALISCGVSRSQIKGGQTYVTEGWVNSNTFRVKAVGVPKKGLTNKYQRRATAKEAALIMAQKRIIEKFVGAAIEGASGMADAQSTGIAVAKEFSGFVKGGSIVKETYDNEQNCEVVYQVESRGLKKRITGFVAKKK
ncbi:hypothetical protein ACFL20_08325 [Spirochaetota bacterium]